jgi:4-amino-4-deoxy-L-arabinose transferase-like glycosyltransferase
MFFSWFKKYKTEVTIVGLALLMRGLFFVAYLIKFGDAGLAYGDASGYLTLVNNLLTHGKFSLFDTPPFHPDGYLTPGYPLLLTFFRLFTAKLWPVGLSQVILGSCTAFLIYRLGSLWNKRIGFIAAIIFALEPTIAFWTPVILTEVVFTFLLVLSFYLILSGLKNGRWGLYFWGGFVLGLDALVRPSAQYIFYLFVLLSVVFLIARDWKKRLIRLLIFIVIFGATIAPWAMRNYRGWGTTSLSSAGWYILAQFSVPEYIKFWKYFPPKKLVELPEAVSCGNSEAIAWNFDCLKENKEYVKAVWRANPRAAIAVHAAALAPFFFGDGYMFILRTFWPEIEPPTVLFGARNLADLPSVPFKLTNIYAIVFWIGKILWTTLYVMVIYGFFASLKNKEARLYILLFAVTIFLFALPAGAIAYARYRFPVNPLIFLMFAYGLDRLLPKRK